MEQALVELVWQRAHARCEYCQLAQASSLLTFEIDHIIAKKHGGATVPENLCLACFYCNSFKGPNIAQHRRANGQARATGQPQAAPLEAVLSVGGAAPGRPDADWPGNDSGALHQ
jgi:5-methylcytosine-specific restriction endonuclease McrA